MDIPPPLQKTRRFLCHYHWDDSRWSVEIHAYDRDDAEARCKALGRLRLDGELVATLNLPARPLGLLGRIFARLLGR